MCVVFELEEVPGGILEKECVVLDPGPGEPDAGLLIEGQSFRLGLFQKPLPRIFRQKRQAEMVGINALLPRQGFCRQMGHELMPREPERDSVAGLPTQRTTEFIDVETFRGGHVVNRKGEMEENFRHCSTNIKHVQHTDPGYFECPHSILPRDPIDISPNIHSHCARRLNPLVRHLATH